MKIKTIIFFYMICIIYSLISSNFACCEIIEYSAIQGQPFSIPLYLRQTKLTGIDIQLAYDPKGIDATDVTLNQETLQSSNYQLMKNLNNDGKITLMIYSTNEPVDTKGLFATLHFTAIGEVDGVYEIKFLEFDCNGEPADGGLLLEDSISNQASIKILPDIKYFYYKDSDNDSYGDPNAYTETWFQPEGYVLNFNDCNDGNPSIHPEIFEICNGKDDNCNGLTDENVTNTYYLDADLDGFGDIDLSTIACEQPEGYVANHQDCNDNDFKENPQQVWYKDIDNDGYSDGSMITETCQRPNGYKTKTELYETTGDCDDSDSSRNPEINLYDVIYVLQLVSGMHTDKNDPCMIELYDQIDDSHVDIEDSLFLLKKFIE